MSIASEARLTPRRAICGARNTIDEGTPRGARWLSAGGMAVYRVVGRGCLYARNYAHFPHAGEGAWSFSLCPATQVTSYGACGPRVEQPDRTRASAVRCGVG